jgi:monofunctional chorismate mutase
MKIVSIRGAITVKENSVENILDSTKELLTEIEKQNNLDRAKVVSIIFSCTDDLDKVYPARAARDMGYTHVGLMCFNEMRVEGSLKKCIRIMIIYNSDISQEDIKHIYLRDAKVLRPDLSNNP